MIWRATAVLCLGMCVLGYRRPQKAIKQSQDGPLVIGYHNSERHEKYASSNPTYEFSYKVKNPHTHDSKGQHETNKGGHVKGDYWMLEPDGRKHTVSYYVDKNNHYKADVYYKTPHLHFYFNTKKDGGGDESKEDLDRNMEGQSERGNSDDDGHGLYESQGVDKDRGQGESQGSRVPSEGIGRNQDHEGNEDQGSNEGRNQDEEQVMTRYQRQNEGRGRGEGRGMNRGRGQNYGRSRNQGRGGNGNQEHSDGRNQDAEQGMNREPGQNEGQGGNESLERGEIRGRNLGRGRNEARGRNQGRGGNRGQGDDEGSALGDSQENKEDRGQGGGRGGNRSQGQNEGQGDNEGRGRGEGPEFNRSEGQNGNRGRNDGRGGNESQAVNESNIQGDNQDIKNMREQNKVKVNEARENKNRGKDEGHDGEKGCGQCESQNDKKDEAKTDGPARKDGQERGGSRPAYPSPLLGYKPQIYKPMSYQYMVYHEYNPHNNKYKNVN